VFQLDGNTRLSAIEMISALKVCNLVRLFVRVAWIASFR